MQVYGRAYHWAREFARFGHSVPLRAPKFVPPTGGKLGKNNAAAIAEAVTRPNMRFVLLKSIEQ